MTVSAGYGFYFGNPNNIMIGWDSDGNGCGFNQTTKSFPMLYWPASPGVEVVTSLQKGDMSKLFALFNSGVCVLKCPEATGDVLCSPTAKMTADPTYANCQYYPLSVKTGSITTRVGAPFRYNSVNVMNHFCLPNATDYVNADTLKQIKNALFNNTVGDTVGEWVFSIAKAWPVICVSIPVAVILGYLYLFIIRAIGGFIIWLSFAVIVLTLAAVGLYAWFYLQY